MLETAARGESGRSDDGQTTRSTACCLERYCSEHEQAGGCRASCHHHASAGSDDQRLSHQVVHTSGRQFHALPGWPPSGRGPAYPPTYSCAPPTHTGPPLAARSRASRARPSGGEVHSSSSSTRASCSPSAIRCNARTAADGRAGPHNGRAGTGTPAMIVLTGLISIAYAAHCDSTGHAKHSECASMMLSTDSLESVESKMRGSTLRFTHSASLSHSLANVCVIVPHSMG